MFFSELLYSYELDHAKALYSSYPTVLQRYQVERS